jgi:predicted dehydrogenase
MWKGGIAGCGFFGQIQLEAWRRMDGVQIVAAADPDLARARNSAQRAYASAEEMLDREQLDFLDIATRPESHPDLVRLAVLRKLPVICQKPIATSWAAALSMVETAERAGVPFMIHENWRWQPWYREAKRRIDRGDIGAPLAYHFRTRKNDGAGPSPYPLQPYFSRMPRLLIHETLVHHIDTARYLFGDIEWVLARTRRINPAIVGEDQAILTLSHAGGLTGVVDGHRFADPAPDGPVLGEATFEGERGVLFLRGDGDLLIGGERAWRNEATEGYRGDSVRATQQHFLDCLENGRSFESGGREYLKTFGAVEAAYRSAVSGCAVRVAPGFPSLT